MKIATTTVALVDRRIAAALIRTSRWIATIPGSTKPRSLFQEATLQRLMEVVTEADLQIQAWRDTTITAALDVDFADGNSEQNATNADCSSDAANFAD